MIKAFLLGSLAMLATATAMTTAMAAEATNFPPGSETETPEEKANKATVIAFYTTALNGRDYEGASKYMGDTYTNHNPTAKDGKEAFKEYVNYVKETFPLARNNIQRAYVDGDFVILHVHAFRTPDNPGSQIVDIFRVDKGKVVEHWATVAKIPEKTANSNGVF